MSIKHFFSTGILLICLASVTGCKKYLDKGIVNPNTTDAPPIEGLLANVTYQTGINVYQAGSFTSNYVQYLASSNAASGFDTYEDLDKSTLWKSIYDIITDSRNMKLLAEKRNAYHHIGVAEITEAMNMNLVIDLFGDAPYSKAWDPTNFKPSYDKGADIYKACLALIDDAILQFGKTDATVELGSNDFIHNGATAQWIKTCYALKARMLNKISKTGAYSAAAVLTAAGNAYQSNADDAQLTQFISLSPWNEIAVNNKNLLLDGWLGAQFVNAVNGTTYGFKDPRVGYMATLTKFNDYRGTVNGAGRVGTGTSKEESYIGTGTGKTDDTTFYAKPGAPLVLISYAEIKFIEAEAALATDRGRAYAAYLEGIKANMEKMGIAAAAKTSYLSNPAVAVGSAALTKDLIFKEKYIALFLNPEAWTDARRYDYKYKNFVLPKNALLQTPIRRIGYPDTEKTRNGSNVPEVGSLADHLWWDQP